MIGMIPLHGQSEEYLDVWVAGEGRLDRGHVGESRAVLV